MRIPLVIALCLLPLQAWSAIQVQLQPSVPSPQAVGTPVVWTATATDMQSGTLNYRFTVKRANSSLIAKDFSRVNTFDWFASIWSGDYEVQVTVRNDSTQETVQLSVPYTLTSRVTRSRSIVSSTSHPLVALFSAPSCPSGSSMRVKFQTAGQLANYTNWRPCVPLASMNFYVAGMLEDVRYLMQAEIDAGGTVSTGNVVAFQTGTASPNTPKVSVVKAGNRQSSLVERLTLWDFVNLGGASAFPVATDIRGSTVWYYPAFDDPDQAGGLLTRMVPGGTMLVMANGTNSANNATRLQILREIDLAGNSIRETNASRINEQLIAMGIPSDCREGGAYCAFTAFHHEAQRLPNGYTMALGASEKIFPAGTQGSPGPIDIISDVIVVLDSNFQVVWHWDGFDHLDINRAALENETCTQGFAACPPLILASTAADWLHTNSLALAPDGNIIVSIRHQDWVIKVDYRNGAGNGDVLWRLGNDGDFTVVSSDPYPWFSHQHDAEYESNGQLTLHDNGNARFVADPTPSVHSRGQAYVLDETNRIATQVLNADLGVYSFALGSAQLLANGNYNFLPGINNFPSSPFSQSTEVMPNGRLNMIFQSSSVAYRSTRVPSLYTLH